MILVTITVPRPLSAESITTVGGGPDGQSKQAVEFKTVKMLAKSCQNFIHETNVSSQRNSDTHSMFRMNGERLFALVRGIGTLFLCFKLMENDCLLTDDEEHHFDDFGYKKNLQPPAERVRGEVHLNST